MYDQIVISNIQKMIYSKLNSKAIDVYFHLLTVSYPIFGGVYIMDFNPHKIKRLMNARNIKITDQQVRNSIQDLLDIELISYDSSSMFEDVVDKSIVRLNKALVHEMDLDTEPHSETYELSKGDLTPYLKLNKQLLTEDFYNLKVLDKRMLLYFMCKLPFHNKNLNNTYFASLKTSLLRSEFKKFGIYTYSSAKESLSRLTKYLHISDGNRNTAKLDVQLIKYSNAFKHGFFAQLITKSEVETFNNEVYEDIRSFLPDDNEQKLNAIETLYALFFINKRQVQNIIHRLVNNHEIVSFVNGYAKGVIQNMFKAAGKNNFNNAQNLATL